MHQCQGSLWSSLPATKSIHIVDHEDSRGFNVPNKFVKTKHQIVLNDNYNMQHKHRGPVIIFSNDRFEVSHIRPRVEHTAAIDKLKEFLPKLGFEKIVIESNLNGLEMLNYKYKLHALYGNLLQESDCIMIIVLAYRGLDKNVILARDTSIEVKEFITQFSTQNFPVLAGKPKLFLIDCRRIEYLNGFKKKQITENDQDYYSVAAPKLQLNIPPSFCDSLAIITPYEIKPFKGGSSLFIASFCEAISYYENKLDETEITEIANKVNEILFTKLREFDKTVNETMRRRNVWNDLTQRLYFKTKLN